jgi:hypothetical protein
VRRPATHFSISSFLVRATFSDDVTDAGIGAGSSLRTTANRKADGAEDLSRPAASLHASLPSIVFPVRNTGAAAASPNPRSERQRGRNADGEKDLQVVIHDYSPVPSIDAWGLAPKSVDAFTGQVNCTDCDRLFIAATVLVIAQLRVIVYCTRVPRYIVVVCCHTDLV